MRLPFAILGYARDRRDIQVAIDAATDLAEHQVRRGYAPPWWQGRARYRREDHDTLPGVERINLPEEVEALGADDCDGHAPYLAGSLRAAGHPARALVIRSPGIGYHVVVGTVRDDGSLLMLDPSARRGMLDAEPREVGRSGRLRRKALAALRRVAQIVRQVETMNPGSQAARGLALEASRLLRVSRAADPTATLPGSTSSTQDDATDDAPREVGRRARRVRSGRVRTALRDAIRRARDDEGDDEDDDEGDGDA